MLKTQPAAKGNFVQVSLPRAFAEAVRAATIDSDRSMAAQLEHWAKLARAIETVLPSAAIDRIKAGTAPTEVIGQLAALLAGTNRAFVAAKLANATTPTYGVDETDPNVVIENHPDGSTVRGSFGDDGRFIPHQPSRPRKDSHASPVPGKDSRRATRPKPQTRSERGLATA